MGGPIVRTGTTPAFWQNWEKAFGKAAAAAKKGPTGKKAKKSAKPKPAGKAKKKKKK
ncbi:MAG: RNA polymerase subunit sigma [Planctomycetia bacterium]|nr:RNA polymerase subunit sigma [Planctomycetia bacterium]